MSVRFENGQSPIHLATEMGKTKKKRKETLVIMFANDIQISFALGRVQIVELLIDNGVDVNMQDANNLIPLYIAAKFGIPCSYMNVI